MSLGWQSERCICPHNEKAIERCGVSSLKLTVEVCLEGYGEGFLQALMHLLLINLETSFFFKKNYLKLPTPPQNEFCKGGFKAK